MNAYYAAGFAAGERAAFMDRRHKVNRIRPEQVRDDYQRGFWDGYTPRTPEWSVRRTA